LGVITLTEKLVKHESFLLKTILILIACVVQNFKKIQQDLGLPVIGKKKKKELADTSVVCGY